MRYEKIKHFDALADGIWEDVFTNRDVNHAAISEDDGKSWIGMREMVLNPLRCRALLSRLEKGAAGLHRGFDDLHNYPERTPLLGYYDGDSPELCDWEIKWALEHGINCFIFCWYRNKNNVGHTVTTNDLRLPIAGA